MKIGNIDLGEKPLMLAPMEDVTDASFRFICKEFGADMTYTEFVSSDGLIRDAKKSLAKHCVWLPTSCPSRQSSSSVKKTRMVVTSSEA